MTYENLVFLSRLRVITQIDLDQFNAELIVINSGDYARPPVVAPVLTDAYFLRSFKHS